MGKVGTCIHNIFCSLENHKDVKKIAAYINNYGFQNEIPNPQELLDSWNLFELFMTTTYGKGKLYHEIPFTHSNGNQIYTGSIDLVWETEEGVILVDYKTFPGTIDQVLDKTSDFYAGKYSGQFECYEKALHKAGKKVVAKLIYYAAGGNVVEMV